MSEHIAIEPELFKRWFDGKQYAPRHLAVSKDGKVLFDRFLDNSMQTAIDAVRQFAGKPGTPEVPADLKAMFSRRDAAARRAVEDRYRTADAAGRSLILEAAGTATNDPAEVLHMGLRDPDDRVFGAAARALAKLADENALPLVEQALARAEDEAVQKALLARLAEIGKRVPAAARLASHFERSSERQLSQPWRNEWSEPAFDVSRRATLDAALDKLEPAVRAAPADAEARLALATAQAAMAEVIFEYTVWLQDGTRVDSTYDRGVAITVQLGNAPLRAWDEGLVGIQAHGRRRMTVPPELAYGAKGVEGMIPPDATLVIEVLALDVEGTGIEAGS
jgi:FKBP-type peptidyl-prolyl cis-trans isomerase